MLVTTLRCPLPSSTPPPRPHATQPTPSKPNAHRHHPPAAQHAQRSRITPHALTRWLPPFTAALTRWLPLFTASLWPNVHAATAVTAAATRPVHALPPLPPPQRQAPVCRAEERCTRGKSVASFACRRGAKTAWLLWRISGGCLSRTLRSFVKTSRMLKPPAESSHGGTNHHADSDDGSAAERIARRG